MTPTTMRNRTRTVLTLAVAGLLLTLAPAAQAATISYLGSDTTTATAWRTTTVAKSSTFDPNGDHAYGNDGYYVIAGGSGQLAPAVSDLPSYIDSVTSYLGGRYNAPAYPNFDNPSLGIGSPVADVDAGIFYAATAADFRIMDFELLQDAAFVLTIPLAGDNAAHNPTTLSVTEAGSAGDTFRIDITGASTIKGIGGVAFEAVPEPSTFLLAALGLLGLMASGGRKRFEI